MQLGPEPLFLGFGRAFAVAGITHSIASVAGELPAAVDTVLLPFGRFIVYDGYLAGYDMGFSDRMEAMLADEAARCKKEGIVVRDGRELAKNAESWIEEDRRHLEEHEEHQKELEAKDEMPEGCHRGVLAGLSPEERERAVKAAVNADFDKMDSTSSADESARQMLRKRAGKRTPTHALAEQLSYLPKKKLQSFARLFDVRGTSKLRKDELAQRLAQAFEASPDFLEMALSSCMPHEIETVQEAVSAGGTKEFDLTNRKDLYAANSLSEMSGLGMVFVSGDTATLCLSDLLLAKASSLDWDGIEEHAKQAQRIIDHINAAVYLRGIVPANDMLEEFGEGLPNDQVIDIIMQSMVDRAGFSVISFEGDPDALYLMTYALSDICYPAEGGGVADDFMFDMEMDPSSTISCMARKERSPGRFQKVSIQTASWWTGC